MIADKCCLSNSCIYKHFCYDCFCVNHLSGNYRLRKDRDEHPDRRPAGPGRHLRGGPGPLLDQLRRHPQRRRDLPQRLRRLRGAARAAARRRELEGTVDVASIEIDEEQLKGHLLSPEFFDAERYPQLRFSSSELSVAEDGAVDAARRARDPRRDARGRGERQVRPARRRPRRQRPRRPLARGQRRPPQLRPRLEGRAAQRRRGPRLRGRDRGRAGAGRGGRVAMRVLGISGSLRRGLAQQRPAAGGRRAAARRGGAGRVRAPGARSRPTTRTSNWRRRPAVVEELREAVRERRRGPDRDPRVQPLDPGPAQERPRLGLAPGRQERPQRQAGGGDRRLDRHVRRGLGPGRAAQGPRRPGRPRGRGRAAGRPRRRASSHGGRLELSPQQSEQLEEILAELIAAGRESSRARAR